VFSLREASRFSASAIQDFISGSGDGGNQVARNYFCIMENSNIRIQSFPTATHSGLEAKICFIEFA